MPICAELHADTGLTIVHQHVFDSLDKTYAAITLAEPGNGDQLRMYFSEIEHIEGLVAALQKLGNELAERKAMIERLAGPGQTNVQDQMVCRELKRQGEEMPAYALKLELTEEQMAEVQAGRDVVVHQDGQDYPVSGIVEADTDDIPLTCSNCKVVLHESFEGLCNDCAALAAEIQF